MSLWGSGLLFSWTPLQSSAVNLGGTRYSGFKYYKVVASETNTNPMYPEDGYLYVGSDRGTSGWSADAAKGGYNKSPELVPGRSYYFAVTYVFENGRFSSNTVRITVPGTSPGTTAPASTTAASTGSGAGFGPPLLSVTGSGSSVMFAWTGLPGDAVTYGGKTYSGFLYYKVVASEINSTPVYPEDGYLYVGTDRGKFTWSVDPSGSGYNPSPVLIPGRSYYFAITYVFENGKFASNTVLYKLPGTEASEASTAPAGFGPPALSASVSGNVLSFLWTPLPGASVTWQGKQYNSFQYYKVVASETNPNPVYPEDGYLYVETDRSVSGWSVDITKSSYNKSPVLTAGKTYYFSVTYVFDNGKFSSGTVQIKLPG